MPLRVNLLVPDIQNEARKSLNVTWREVISAGLIALRETKTDPLANLKADIRPHLVSAYNSIKVANDILLKGALKQPVEQGD